MSRLYGIVDTARDKRLFPLVQSCPEYVCLFAGDLPVPLDAASPYLVALSNESPLKDVWQNEGWGKAWGILVRSALPLMELRRHLRQFLLVQLPDGDVVFFRFFDPRVWRTYWPSCTPEEQAKWKQGIDEFVAEEHTA